MPLSSVSAHSLRISVFIVSVFKHSDSYNKSVAMAYNKRLRYCILAVVTVIASFVFWNAGHSRRNTARTLRPLSNELEAPQLPCRSLPGANETLVVLRTGSTELEDRFSIHLSTSLRCFQYYLIFSDYEEHYRGEHILDALDSVDPQILTNNEDFELYRRLKQNGRAALAPSELSGSKTQVASSSGNAENPGWKLDKWKFLPMVNRTFYEHPNMKWYVFIEADTFILWSMLQSYLASTDHTKPHYAGDEMSAGKETFAHGGAGFVVSQPALRMVVEYYATYKAEIESLTSGHWAGDILLGRTFLEAGVPLTDVWPLMNGDNPGARLYARADDRSVPNESWQVWCQPTVSYHHMSPAAVEDLWRFEQRWLQTKLAVS